MSNGLTGWVSIGIPSIASIFAWVFTKPVQEEARIGRLRKNLLSHFRFKISVEIANVLPDKTDKIQKDHYVAICRDTLNEYFSGNSMLLTDFLGCEKLFKSYIKFLRYFKYGVVLIPVIGILLGVISKIFLKNTYHGIILIILISLIIVLPLLIILLWFLMETKKDKYHDLCSKYEVIDDESYKKDKYQTI